MEINLDDFDVALDDDEEGCILTLTGEDGEKYVFKVERDLAEELSLDIVQVLGLEDAEEDD
jgi:hypothetical protein